MGVYLYVTPEDDSRSIQIGYGSFAAFISDVSDYFFEIRRPIPPALRRLLESSTVVAAEWTPRETCQLYDILRPHLRGFQQWCDEQFANYHANIYLHLVEILEHAVDRGGQLQWE